MCAIRVGLCIKDGGVVLIFFFPLSACTCKCAQRTWASAGLNASGGPSVCTSVCMRQRKVPPCQENPGRITPAPPSPSQTQPPPPPPRRPSTPADISTPPRTGLYTMFSPRLVRHLPAHNFRMGETAHGQSQMRFYLTAE